MNKEKTYYKPSNYDPYHGIIGKECISEIIVDRLLDILKTEHLSYQLIHADILVDDKIIDTYLCASLVFKQPIESKIALDSYCQSERSKNESPPRLLLKTRMVRLYLSNVSS